MRNLALLLPPNFLFLIVPVISSHNVRYGKLQRSAAGPLDFDRFLINRFRLDAGITVR